MSFSKKCPICGGQFSQSLPYLNKEYPTVTELQGLTIVICDNCGFGMAIPERSWQVMERFYRRLYRAPGSVHRHTALALFNKYSISTRALSQWMLLRTFRSFSSKDTFCDIGPGGVVPSKPQGS